jgi:hypothetical protein
MFSYPIKDNQNKPIWGVYKSPTRNASIATESVLRLLSEPINVVVPTGLTYDEAYALAKLMNAAQEG